MADPTARQIRVIRCREDAGSGVHFMSPGLLQLTVLRGIPWTDNSAAIYPE